MQTRLKAAAISGAAASLLLVAAPSANASVHSISVRDGTTGDESIRWADEQYSELRFIHCNSESDESVDVSYWRDISLYPDTQYDQKTFTACFKWSDGDVSRGEWRGLPKGNYYFQLGLVDDTSSHHVTAAASVDTTAAD
ncbi:hypothetical protein ACWGII_14480 [Streptomyces sp. NPDC054855]